MLFLIDGYNVVMRDPATADLGREAMRDALVARLASAGRMLLGNGQVVVVFDARAQYGATSSDVGAVKVVYAADADDEIVRRASLARGNVTVVTDDMRMRARISQDVGRRVDYRDAATVFAGAGGARRRKPTAVRETAEKPVRGAADITKELEKLWIDEDE